MDLRLVGFEAGASVPAAFFGAVRDLLPSTLGRALAGMLLE
jgi:hypothetical protein